MFIAFAIAQILAAALALGGVVRLQQVGQMGGSSDAVAVSGSTAFVGIGPRLVTMDVSEPGNIRRLGESVVLDGVVTDIALVGHYAYVTDGRGLKVIDVSEPAAPRVVGTGLQGKTTQAVEVAGNLAYVLGPERFYVVDVARPEVPLWLGQIVTTADSWDVAVSDGRAYVVGDGGLTILDVSSPSAPLRMRHVALASSGKAVAVRGGMVYVGTYSSGLRVINAVDPATMHEVGFWWDGRAYAVSAIQLVGRYVLVADDRSIRWLDISSPGTPREASPPRFTDGAADVAVVGDRAITVSNVGLEVFDITDIQDLRPVGGLDWPMFLTRVHVAGHLALVGDNQAQVHVLNVADPAHPIVLGRTRLRGDGVRVGRIITDGIRAYVPDGSGLWILDVSTPSAPHEVAYVKMQRGVGDVAVGDGYAYVMDGEAGLNIMDVTPPVTPTMVSRLPGIDGGLKYADGFVYAGGLQEPLQVIDVSDPTRPRVVGSLAGEYGPFDVAGGYLYMTDGDGMHVFDVQRPEAPRRVADVWLQEPHLSVHVADDRAYLTDNSHRLWVVDISDPLAPMIATTWEAPDYHLLTAAAAGDFVYLANAAGGLAVLRAADPVRLYLPTAATGRSGTVSTSTGLFSLFTLREASVPSVVQSPPEHLTSRQPCPSRHARTSPGGTFPRPW